MRCATSALMVHGRTEWMVRSAARDAPPPSGAMASLISCRHNAGVNASCRCSGGKNGTCRRSSEGEAVTHVEAVTNVDGELR